jgi:hypothetical protein
MEGAPVAVRAEIRVEEIAAAVGVVVPTAVVVVVTSINTNNEDS